MDKGIMRLVLLFLSYNALIAAATTTETVSVTSTTTIHATATDYKSACDNFVGACVVYGTYGGAQYTTTVYRNAPPPPPPPTSTPVVTSTITFIATTTAPNSAACDQFSGACVVYGDASSTSTVYYPSGSANLHGGVGNSQGYIGPNEDSSGPGYIGEGATLRMCWTSGAALIFSVSILAFWI